MSQFSRFFPVAIGAAAGSALTLSNLPLTARSAVELNEGLFDIAACTAACRAVATAHAVVYRTTYCSWKRSRMYDPHCAWRVTGTQAEAGGELNFLVSTSAAPACCSTLLLPVLPTKCGDDVDFDDATGARDL